MGSNCRRTIGRDDSLMVRVRVANSPIVPATRCRRSTSGREWRAPLPASAWWPIGALTLAAHESRVVEFTVPTSQLALLSPDNLWQIVPGVYEVTVGNSRAAGWRARFEIAR